MHISQCTQRGGGSGPLHGTSRTDGDLEPALRAGSRSLALPALRAGRAATRPCEEAAALGAAKGGRAAARARAAQQQGGRAKSWDLQDLEKKREDEYRGKIPVSRKTISREDRTQKYVEA